MRIVVANDNKLPYRESAPVQGKLTVLNAVLGRLLHADKNYDLTGGHLKNFRWDYNKKAYILKLKENLYFHNGRKVNSKDLEFSIVRGFFSKNRHWFESFFSNIEGIENAEHKKFKSGIIAGIKLISKNSLQIKLKKPNPSFLHSIAIAYFSLVPIEELKDDYITWKKYPVGVGNYKIINIKNDNSIELEEVENTKNKILFTVSGQQKNSDIVLNSFGGELKLNRSFSEKTTSVTGIFFNFNNPFANDLNFRKAIDLMLDRDSLVKDIEIYKKTNQFLASHFGGRISQTNKQNVMMAKQYLSRVKNLNLKDNFKIPVFNSYFNDVKHGQYLVRLKRQFKELGINVSFYETNDKFLKKDDNQTLFKIFSLGADVMEPLILFGLMRGNSPFYPHFPKSIKYDQIFKSA